MKPEARGQETDEQFIARIVAMRQAKLEAKKPKLTVTVSPKVAEAVKANPESVKVAVKGPDETVLVERFGPRKSSRCWRSMGRADQSSFVRSIARQGRLG